MSFVAGKILAARVAQRRRARCLTSCMIKLLIVLHFTVVPAGLELFERGGARMRLAARVLAAKTIVV